MLSIGHRGAMGHAPENTLASVREALRLGVDGIEVDVYCIEGRLLVFHDDRLERTTNGNGYLCEHSFAQLRALDAGGGEQIPTLEEVLDLVDARVGVNIELKGAGTAAPVAALIERYRARGWANELFLVSSFNHRELQQLKTLDARIRLGVLLVGLPVDDAAVAERLGAFSIHPCNEFIDQRFVEDAHRRNLRVYVFTVDHPQEIERMRALGVDGVFSNYPERVVDSSQGCGRKVGWD